MSKTTPAGAATILAPHPEVPHAPSEKELLRAPRLPQGPEFSQPLHQYADLLRPYTDAECLELDMVIRLVAYRRRVRYG